MITMYNECLLFRVEVQEVRGVTEAAGQDPSLRRVACQRSEAAVGGRSREPLLFHVAPLANGLGALLMPSLHAELPLLALLPAQFSCGPH